MTPADRREFAAIVSRLNRIEAICLDIEKLVDPENRLCPTPPTETSGASAAHTTKHDESPSGPCARSVTESAPPDLDAIRKADEYVCGDCGGHPEHAVIPLHPGGRLHAGRPVRRNLCQTQTSETSGAQSAPVTGGTSSPMQTVAPHKSNASGATEPASAPPDCRTSPPDLDAIRKAWNRLRDAREGYLRSERRCEDVRPIGEAVAALLALDVPAVVAALMDEAKGERYVAGCERADRLDAEARAEKAERELTNVALTLEVMSNGVKKAEQERDEAQRDANIEGERADTYRSKWQEAALRIEALTRERDEARAQIATARDAALEEAAVYLDTLKMYGTQAKLAAAIRGMKGKP